MFSRRGFVKLGAASVASLALRPFGLLPGLAQSNSSDYRALVCVFLFGGNDSNNMVVPVDDTNYRAYTSIRGSLALTPAELTQTLYATSNNAPYAFHSDLTELASMFSNKELAVVANVGSLVQPTTRVQYQAQQSLPVNLFSHSDQQLQWQTSIPSGTGSTGWAGRAADLISSQNSSSFPTFLSVAGNSIMGNGATTQPVAISPGQSLDLQGFNGQCRIKCTPECTGNSVDYRDGSTACAGIQFGDARQHLGCQSAGCCTVQVDPLADQISDDELRRPTPTGCADPSSARRPWHESADLFRIAGWL